MKGEMLADLLARLLKRVGSPRHWFGIGIAVAAFFLLGCWPYVTMPLFEALDWLAGPRGHIRNTIVEAVGSVLLPVDMGIAMFGLFHAAGLLWVCVIGLWCWERRGRPTLTGALALMIALAGNGLIAAFSARFFTVPAGASIRPMAEGVWVMMVSLYTIVAVGGLCLYAVFRESGRSWMWAVVACPVAIETFFLGGQLIRWASALNHFTLAE